jgi:transcriptional regulator with XRE-family HTH domain
MTLEDVANATGGRLTPSMIGSYEQGAEPGISRYIILCLALGVCLTDLLPDDVADMIGKRINLDRITSSMETRR